MKKPVSAGHESDGKKPWKLTKIFMVLFVAAVIFGGGIAVGRGNIRIGGLSPSGNNADLSNQLDYSSVNAVYKLLKTDYDGSLDTTKLIDGAKSGLVASIGDPYTEYFDPTDAKAFNNELSGSITGIGAELGADDSGNIEIVSPLSGYPAAAAGLQPKDLITAINGISTSGLSVDDAVLKIRGAVGTKVTLTIVRGSAAPMNVVITRQTITIPSVTWSEANNIGYLKISQFTNDTVGLAQKAATEFKAKGVKGVVLDLRGNPGGYLSGAVNVSSLWLNQGQTVVSERRGSTVIDTETATGTNTLKGLPTIVLIDGGSASASEITAGALHDNHDATLVGVQSFGKGSVQEVENLPDGSEVKITIAHWYTPDGVNINKKGLTPDTVISNNGAATGTDPQLDKANALVQAQIGS